MTGSEHLAQAEALAKQARDRLERGDNLGAIAYAAVSQAHAALVGAADARPRPQHTMKTPSATDPGDAGLGPIAGDDPIKPPQPGPPKRPKQPGFE